ncbi:hypothetical protein BCR42DRAFT_429745, partial [Absidia repens]
MNNPRAQLSSCMSPINSDATMNHHHPVPPPQQISKTASLNIGIIWMTIFPGCPLLACNMNRQLAHTMTDL